MWKVVAGGVVLGSVAYGLLKYFAGGACRCTARLDGLVVVVTGASSGIGKALAIELAQKGATLVLACRSVERGLEAKQDIVRALSAANREVAHKIFVKHLDLASVASIVKFSGSLKSEFAEIYALVNNAGIFHHQQRLTEDGYEITFQTNYLGPFILTHHLLSLLRRSEHARIVNVASEAHRNVNAYDLKAVTTCQTEFRSHFVAYGVSKLALVLFTRQLFKKLKNTNIIVNAANPGNVETAIYRHYPPLNNFSRFLLSQHIKDLFTAVKEQFLYTNIIVNAANPGNVETAIYRHYPPLNNWFLYALQWPLRVLVVKSPRQGCQTILHCLLTSNRSTGQYYSDCKLTLPSPLASDDRLAREYYELTLEILDDKFSTESDC